MADDSERACWICLSAEGELTRACNCPEDRVVHRKCLARWQLQSAGKSEEHRCRFCQAVYPSWKESLTPPQLRPAVPVVSVHYNGMCYRLKVRPGPEGLSSFQKQLQCITGLSELDCMQITFQCRAPETCEELNFKGISAFDAAIHCASISAAERQAAAQAAKAAAVGTEGSDRSSGTGEHTAASSSGGAVVAGGASHSGDGGSTPLARPAHRSAQASPVAPLTQPSQAQRRHAHSFEHPRSHTQPPHSASVDSPRAHAGGAPGSPMQLPGASSASTGSSSPSCSRAVPPTDLNQAEERMEFSHPRPQACPVQERSRLQRMQDMLRGLFL